MINKENKNNEPDKEPVQDTGFIDTARMDVNCHLVIKDKETGEELVNKRG